jgi:hypothetical protein
MGARNSGREISFEPPAHPSPDALTCSGGPPKNELGRAFDPAFFDTFYNENSAFKAFPMRRRSFTPASLTHGLATAFLHRTYSVYPKAHSLPVTSTGDKLVKVEIQAPVASIIVRGTHETRLVLPNLEKPSLTPPKPSLIFQKSDLEIKRSGLENQKSPLGI